jgi:hypothetical protein
VAKANSSSLSLNPQSPAQHKKPAKKTPAKKAAIQSPAEAHPFSQSSSEANVALALVAHKLYIESEDYIGTMQELEESPYFSLLVKETFGVTLGEYKGKHNGAYDLIMFAAVCYNAGRVADKVRDIPASYYPKPYLLSIQN